MIRLCDKEVYAADIRDVTRGELIGRFCAAEGEKPLCFLYDGEEEAGYISYDILFKNPNKEIEECMETAFITVGEDMFVQARKFFSEYPEKTWVLVRNEDGAPECFAYHDYEERYDEIESVIQMIEQDIIEKNSGYTLREVYPWVRQIHIYDCNEWAYRLYRTFLEWNIPVRVFGDKWRYVLGNEIACPGECPDYEIMRIFAESHDYAFRKWTNTTTIMGKCYNSLVSSFQIVYVYGVMNYRRQVELFMSEIKEKMSCFICKIPDFEGLKNKSALDCYRNRERITMREEKMFFKWEEEELKRVCGMNPKEYYDKMMAQTQEEREDNSRPDRDGRNIIYLVGPCIVSGNFVWKEHTLVNYMQELVDRAQLDYVIKPIHVGEHAYRIIEKELPDMIEDSPGNMVIFFEEDIRDAADIEKTHKIQVYDLDVTELFDHATDEKPLYYDKPIHTNARGNQALARRIFEALILPASKKILTEERLGTETGPHLTIGMKRRLGEYLDNIKIQCLMKVGPGKRGAIVMNCNPFTRGHKYLIEQARSRVEQLFIFVVEEDKAQIPFADRFEMVKRGVEEMENVYVFPSGEFILLFHTLPSYFAKESLQEERIDASEDIHIFGAHVAPALDISVRFTGTEPIDKVTRQYNEEMGRTLKRYGVEYVEIPRLEDDNGVISASRVRKYLENGDWESLGRSVPESTYEYLGRENDNKGKENSVYCLRE